MKQRRVVGLVAVAVVIGALGVWRLPGPPPVAGAAAVSQDRPARTEQLRRAQLQRAQERSALRVQRLQQERERARSANDLEKVAAIDRLLKRQRDRLEALGPQAAATVP